MNVPIYLEYDFTVTPKDPATEILIAELGFAGFESFVENDQGVTAYIQKEEWSADILADIHILSNEEFTITYSQKEIEQVNWNEEWEKNFDPIFVADSCVVRAPFHEVGSFEYDIIIEPKMSFGTGHHETTYMMIQHLLAMDLSGKSVLDMGCGTGVLAIMAEKRGAIAVDAIDIDNWCYINSLENVERNECKTISVFEGDATLLEKKRYDVIIANINRNILINDMATYASCLNEGGIILLSGFYKEDIPIIAEECKRQALKFVENFEKNNWVATKFVN